MAYQNQNLADILRTLSGFTGQQPPAAPSVFDTTHYAEQEELEEGEYDPTSFNANDFNHAASHQGPIQSQSTPRLQALKSSHHALNPSQHHQHHSHSQPPTPHSAAPQPLQPRQTQPPTQTQPQAPSSQASPQTDPRTIINWAAAMSYTRRLLTDDGIVERIRKLGKNQALNERQWWDGRLALVKKQSERGQTRDQINDVLKAIGGRVGAPAHQGGAGGLTPEDDAAELARYDGKVYAALARMVNGMQQELAMLGVPFFCTRSALIRDEGGDLGVDGVATISRGTLTALQRRMLEYLEVSCQE